jgi:hypothetical protein
VTCGVTVTIPSTTLETVDPSEISTSYTYLPESKALVSLADNCNVIVAVLALIFVVNTADGLTDVYHFLICELAEYPTRATLFPF